MVRWIIGLLIVTLSLSSCDTLKQKFVRKKKGGEDESALNPVLEPEEYPSPALDPRHNYVENYDLIKAWYKDLWTAIDDKSTSRYIHYEITEVTTHIEQMKKFVDDDTQAKLDKLEGFLSYYDSSLDESWQARNMARIRTDLIEFDRYMRDNLRIDKIKGHLVSAPSPNNGAPPLAGN